MSESLALLRGLLLEEGDSWGARATDWQRADAEAVLEPGDGPRWHFLTRPRGGSKSTDLAAVLLVWLLRQAGRRSRGYVAAADGGQAAVLLDALAGLAERTGLAGSHVDVQASKVVARESGAAVEVLTADGSGSFGLRPDFVVVDELAAWSETRNSRRVWTALLTAMAKRPGSRMVILTSAGDPAHFSYRVLEEARSSAQWRTSEVDGPLPWADPANLEAQRRLLLPSEYAQLHENVWATAEDRLATREDVLECMYDYDVLPFEAGRRYVTALDIGTTHDASVGVVAHREDRHVVVDRMRRWLPSPGHPVRHQDVEEWVRAQCAAYRAPLVYDPSQWIGASQRLSEEGLRTEQFNFTTGSVGKLGRTLFQLLRDHELELPGNEDLIDELVRVRLRKTSEGGWRLDHDRDGHDDQAVTIALAAQWLLEHSEVRRGQMRFTGRRPVVYAQGFDTQRFGLGSALG